ncbi:MAG TPA: TonB-dependent receptor plug domain-containing protein, partial [Mucilaginibacter sp.]|nr:TonB-dependent receptor plug domain-containing protein [Mucilaginibacter sp.]
MKHLLLLAFFCCLSAIAVAQAQPPPQLLTVKGVTIDSATNKPLGYVTVSLLDATTKQSVKAGLSKDDGSFELKAPAGKTYQLALVSVGYKGKTVNLVGTGTALDAGKILMSASSKQLSEVSVTAAKPLMKQEVDRITYDVQADPDSKALDVLDMMRKVPLLSVDGNDNIQLKGSGNYKILINGKESALVAKNPSDILKSMPATNIERIEVITTPPAKYDAEGLAGIINIVTKRNADQGYNIGFNSRFNSVFGAGYNINGTVKEGKFGASFFGGFGSNGTLTTNSQTTENIFAAQTNIDQNSTNTQKGNFHYGGTELSYEIDSLNLLTASVDLFGNDQSQYGPGSSTTDSVGILKQMYNFYNSGNSSFTGLDASFNYQLSFKKSKDRLLTISY